MTGDLHQKSMNNRHLTDEELVAFLDGELPAEESARAQAHTDGCAQCSAQLHSLREDLRWVGELHRASIPEQSILENPPIAQFTQRLAAHAVQARTRKTGLSQFPAAVGKLFQTAAQALWQRKTAALATVVAFALVIATTTIFVNPRASADTILLRSEKYEVNLRPKAGSVSRSVVSLEVAEPGGKAAKHLGTVTVLHDSVTPALHMSAEFSGEAIKDSTVASDLSMGFLSEQAFGTTNVLERSVLDYLKAQNCFPDLSIPEFRKLVAGRGEQKSRVSTSDGIFELHFPFAAEHVSGIREAVLWVQKNTYEPLQMNLYMDVKDNHREYRFIRSSFSVLPRGEELAKAFRISGTALISQTAPEMAINNTSLPLSYLNSKATAEEVVVSETLHGVDACLGEEINVFPMQDGSLLVQGLVDQPERRDTLRRVLAPLSSARVRTEIYTPEDLKSGYRLYPPPDGESAEASSTEAAATAVNRGEFPDGQIPFHDKLYKRFIESGRSPEEAEGGVAKFSKEITDRSRKILLHAWALKKLDQEFVPGRITGLSGESQRVIETMRQDHLRTILELTRKVSESLAALSDGARPAPDSDSPATGNSNTKDLLSLAQEQDRLAHRLFARSEQSSKDEADLPELLGVLRQLDAATARRSSTSQR